MQTPTPIGLPCPDAEELAVLLEGGLRASRRRRLFLHIGSCDTCYATFSGSARYLLEERELHEGADEPVPFPGWSVSAPIAAAALAAAVACALILSSPAADHLRAVRGPARQAASIAGLGALAERPEHPWSFARSAGGDELDWRGGFRVGVLLADLSATQAIGDTVAAERLVSDLYRLLHGAELDGGSLEGLFDGVGPALVEGGDAGLEGFERAAARMRGAPVWAFVRLGAWAESGRLAALAGDDRYFRRPEARRPPEETTALELPADVAAALERCLDAVGAAGTSAAMRADSFSRLVAQAGRYAIAD